jgi:DnaJ family protein C protein 10
MWWSALSTVFLFLVKLVLAGEDYYKLLGVSKDADERTIRRAFKKIAITKHPDKDQVDFYGSLLTIITFQDNPNAHADFIKINKAYEVLKDPDLRRKYDQHGEEVSEFNLFPI